MLSKGIIHMFDSFWLTTLSSWLIFLSFAEFSTIVGIHCKDGIILGSEKIVVSKMMVPGTDPRIFSVTKHIGSTVNGLVPDGKALMYRGREEANQYEKMFGVVVPGRIMSERVAAVAHM